MKSISNKKYSILQSLTKYISVFVIVFALVMPVIVMGEGGTVPSGGGTVPSGGGTVPSGGGTVPSGTNSNGVKVNVKIENPLKGDINDIPSFIVAILNIIMLIGVPIVALAIIYCGFLFVKALGNPEALTKAKRAFIYTLIGAALLLGALVLANAIQGTVEEITKGV